MSSDPMNLLAKLGLVASDSSYRQQATFGTNERLGPHLLGGCPGDFSPLLCIR